ncbi:DUF2062 domain-containing protein [Desulfovibrio aerotolerans]|uniref:DUF2062 domain-containing protein n=1 Tax=Solidesulfovibrio aerotolerans TaxID=295255 RepID=A0A7C9IYZ3_9BACT|nr:DUF2062 domain-containing protein [Solidesulfovibrio aerotolerans]MYL85362.1 DUF2062 domain-containing protein [Solidesulfovibrio aerotolerans]
MKNKNQGDASFATKRAGQVMRLLRLKWLTLLRIKKTPHEIALGFAFGVFFGFIPIIPFQSIWAIGLCWVFVGSKLAAFAGAWVSNPVTFTPLYTALYFVGKLVLPELALDSPPFILHSDWLDWDFIFDTGWKLALILNTGGIVLGVPAALLSYFLAYFFVKKYQGRKGRHTAPLLSG